MQDVAASNPGGEPLREDLRARVREILGASPKRSALGGFGVSHVTMANALAGLPISRGSRALIEIALNGTLPKQEGRIGATSA